MSSERALLRLNPLGNHAEADVRRAGLNSLSFKILVLAAGALAGGFVTRGQGAGWFPLVWVALTATILLLTLLLLSTRRFLLGIALLLVPIQNAASLDVGLWIFPAYAVLIVFIVRAWPEYQAPKLRVLLDRVALGFLGLAAASSIVGYILRPEMTDADLEFRYGQLRPLLQLTIILFFVLTYFTISRVVSASFKAYKTALRAFVASGVVVALYALYQQAAYLLGWPGLELFSSLRSVRSLVYEASGVNWFRSSGTFVEPHLMGQFLTGSLLVTIMLSQKSSHIMRSPWTALSLAGIQLMAIFTTLAFSALLGVVAGAIALGIFSMRARRAQVIAVLLLAGTVVAVLATSDDYLGNGSRASAWSQRISEVVSVESAGLTSPYVGGRRSDFRRVAFRMLMERPLTGVGLGNFGFSAHNYDARLPFNAGSYGAVWGMIGEFGIGGLVVIAGFLSAMTLPLLSRNREVIAARPVLVGFAAGFVAMFLHYFGNGYTRMDLHMWTFLGLAAGCWKGGLSQISQGQIR